MSLLDREGRRRNISYIRRRINRTGILDKEVNGNRRVLRSILTVSIAVCGSARTVKRASGPHDARTQWVTLLYRYDATISGTGVRGVRPRKVFELLRP